MKKVATMNGNALKNLFNPISIKTKYTLWDWLNERNMTANRYLHDVAILECAKSKNKTCANFECRFNYRLNRKAFVTGEYQKYLKKSLW